MISLSTAFTRYAFALLWLLTSLLNAHAEFNTSAMTAVAMAWLRQPTLPEPWQGLQGALIDQGIEPTIIYMADLLGNPVGGQRQDFAYAGDLGLYLDVDFERLLGLRGVQMHTAAAWSTGYDLSAEAIGNTFTAAQIFSGDSIRLYTLAIEQFLFDDRLSVLVGRLSTADDFMTSPLYNTFVSSAFNNEPGSVLINVPGFTMYPLSTWGARIWAQPHEQFYVMAGVYNNNTDLARNSAHGVDFSLDGSVFVVTEMGYHHNQNGSATGLPGTYKVGAYYDASRLADLRSSLAGTRRGSYGLYFLIDQMVYREGGMGSQQGLTPFVGVMLAPWEHRNPLPFFVMTGLVYQGLFPDRDNDTTSFGMAYGQFSTDLDDTMYEVVLEWSHTFMVAPWIMLQPDVQYIIQPGGTDAVPNAVVLGLQVIVVFSASSNI